jgi:hypothetical protein
LFQLGLFVSGVVVGATALWFSQRSHPVVAAPNPPPVVEQPKKVESENEEDDEEDEEDEEYDSDEDLSSGEEEEAENTPHKLVRVSTQQS